MSLFYVYVWEKSKKNKTKPVWKSPIVAEDIEEAYVIGKAQFKLEMPDISIQNFTIEASGFSVDK